MAGLPIIYTVRLDLKEDREEEFNEWASTRHISDLMDAGFLSAVRFRAVKGAPRYLHMYELSSSEILASEKYDNVRARDETGAGLRDAILNHSAAVFSQDVAVNVPSDVRSDGGPIGGIGSRFMITVRMEVDPAASQELVRWHREEHIPTLLQADGMLTGRLCHRIGLHPQTPCHEPEWLSIYEMESHDTLKDPKVKEANETDWAQRMHAVTTDVKLDILERIAPP